MKVSNRTSKKFSLLAAIDHALQMALKLEVSMDYIKNIAALRQKAQKDAWDSVWRDFPEDKGKTHSYNHLTGEITQVETEERQGFTEKTLGRL